MSIRKRKKLLKCIEHLYGGTRGRDILQFAIDLDVSLGAARKWLSGERRPYYHTMKDIERLTRGGMRVSDW